MLHHVASAVHGSGQSDLLNIQLFMCSLHLRARRGGQAQLAWLLNEKVRIQGVNYFKS